MALEGFETDFLAPKHALEHSGMVFLLRKMSLGHFDRDFLALKIAPEDVQGIYFQ
jgi:hypothetical protein